MSRGIKTITDFPANGMMGLAGGYSVETLERQLGKDQKERKLFNGRRSIITINFAQQHNITIETTANAAEKKTLPAQQVFAPSCKT
jgi:hypothetical protein